MKIEKIIILMLLIASPLVEVSAQHVAIKNNLAGDALMSPNLAIETALGRNTTLDLYGAYNPFGSDKDRFKHWYAQPEFRYWFCERFNGTFIGIHGVVGEFSVAGKQWPILSSTFDEHRYEGNVYGGGISIGHQWILSNRWSIEASVGVGYLYFDYDKYKCKNCSPKEKSDTWNYVGPTKAELSLIYIIK